MFAGEAVAATLAELGVTHVVWLPDSALGPWEAALEASPVRLVRVCREGEAWAIAAGLYLGGASPLVMMFMQNTKHGVMIIFISNIVMNSVALADTRSTGSGSDDGTSCAAAAWVGSSSRPASRSPSTHTTIRLGVRISLRSRPIRRSHSAASGEPDAAE